jgi:Flp pilus assembly protein TadG
LFRDGGRAYLGRVARAVQRERGQASVETVALVPVLVLLTVATWQAALAGWALVSVQSAARAAARAALAGSPARPAALAALPEGMRRGASTRIADGRVTVRVHIPAVLPGFAFDVSASAQAARQ